jgi:hypothetical protein
MNPDTEPVNEGVAWPTIDPQHMVTTLQKLSAEACHPQRQFFKSYKKWGSLDETQRNKTKVFFETLSPAVRALVVRDATATEAATFANNNQRAENTDANDRTRVIHLMVCVVL